MKRQCFMYFCLGARNRSGRQARLGRKTGRITGRGSGTLPRVSDPVSRGPGRAQHRQGPNEPKPRPPAAGMALCQNEPISSSEAIKRRRFMDTFPGARNRSGRQPRLARETGRITGWGVGYPSAGTRPRFPRLGARPTPARAKRTQAEALPPGVAPGRLQNEPNSLDISESLSCSSYQTLRTHAGSKAHRLSSRESARLLGFRGPFFLASRAGPTYKEPSVKVCMATLTRRENGTDG